MAPNIKETPSGKWPGYSQPERIMYLGRALVLSKKRPKTAEKLLLQSLEMNPDLLFARQTLILLCCQAKWFDKAETLIEAYRQRYPDDPNADIYQGWLFFVQKQYDQAVTLLRDSLRHDWGKAMAALSDIHWQSKSNPRARQIWEDPDIRSRMPRSPTPDYITETTGEYQEAAIEERLKSNPDDVDALLEKAEHNFGMNKWTMAEALYLRAIELAPENPKAHYLYARFDQNLSRLGRPGSNAFEHYMIAARLCPADPIALQNAGQEKMMLAFGDYENRPRLLADAIQILQNALELNPDYPPTHRDLGVCFSHLGLPEEALAHYDRAIKEIPSAGFLRFSVLCTLRRTEDAMAALVEELKGYPRDQERRMCAELVESSGDAQTALALLEDNCIIDPTDPYNHKHYAECLERTGRQREASAAIRRAFACRPKGAPLQGAMARFLKEMGHRELAREWAKKAKASNVLARRIRAKRDQAWNKRQQRRTQPA
ncbi:MAG: tetratricopeptide repeat protein [Armatimonadota bacterium]